MNNSGRKCNEKVKNSGRKQVFQLFWNADDANNADIRGFLFVHQLLILNFSFLIDMLLKLQRLHRIFHRRPAHLRHQRKHGKRPDDR